ncbi:hypothetical protein BB559_007183, partial [Furculomyces boomerangus]
ILLNQEPSINELEPDNISSNQSSISDNESILSENSFLNNPTTTHKNPTKPPPVELNIEPSDNDTIPPEYSQYSKGMILPKSHFINSISSINSELLSKLKESLTNDEHIKKLFPDFSINGEIGYCT